MKLMLRATINIPQTNNLWKRKISPWKRVASWLLWSKSMTNQMIYTVLFWLFFRDCKIKNNLYQEKKLSDNTSALGSISSHTEYPISNFFGHTCLYFYGLFPISPVNHRHITKSAQTIGKSLRLRWERWESDEDFVYYSHTSMGFLPGEVTGQAEIGDSYVTILIQ